MPDIFGPVVDFLNSTHVVEQIREIDAKGLFTNAWFLIPFLSFLGYKLYKQDVNALVLTGIAVGLWLFSGSSYMAGLVVGGHIQIGKILPVAFVFIGAIAVVVYFLFMRSD
jgi:hypothetical protein